MKFTLHLATAALIALPFVVRAEGTGSCDASKACCATKATAAASGTCCASKGNHVMLKLKGGKSDSVSAALAKLEGVTAAETCSESKFTTISFDKEKVCSSKIMAALADAGYKVRTQRVTYAVEGLACGACSTKVTKALSKVRGVSDAKVCTESKQAVIDFNPNRVSVEKILAALDASGFKATEAVN
ncbi:MAG: cation transporter [Verrucomicrobiales bacterium]|nr:cation transporter [Verrucomicrobiales bacterium]